MRKLGIDYGTKKIGLALTDEAGQMAFPHAVVPNTNSFLNDLEALVTEQEVSEIVIGQSLDLDGTPNSIQTDIEELVADMTLRIPIPIHLEPEQLTSQQAAAVTGKNDQIDAAAAAIILDTWLQKQIVDKSKEQSAATESEVQESAGAVREISFDDFLKVEIKIGLIESVQIVEGADKLLQLTVDVGEPKPRQILSGIREYFTDEQELVGKKCPFITNLPPRKIRGIESQGMILAGDSDDTFALLHPSNNLPAGTRLY